MTSHTCLTHHAAQTMALEERPNRLHIRITREILEGTNGGPDHAPDLEAGPICGVQWAHRVAEAKTQYPPFNYTALAPR